MNLADASENFDRPTWRCAEISAPERVLAARWLTARLKRKFGPAHPAFPLSVLPRTGLAVVDEFGPVAVAFLYLEKSTPCAVCGYLVTAPDNRPRESYAAVKLLLAELPLYARDLGAENLLCYFGHKVINRLLGKLGYLLTEKAECRMKMIGG